MDLMASIYFPAALGEMT